MSRFESRVAVVTGGANGIGRAIVERFAREGARVVIADRDAAAGEALAASVTADGGIARFVRTDVSVEAEVRALVAAAVASYGGLHIMVNNAGVEGANTPIGTYSLAEYDRLMAINVRGVFVGMQAALAHMVSAGGGVILNMASVAGLKGFAGLGPYVASKHALIGLTKTAALEYATQQVRVNAVCPGAVVTDMIHRIAGHDPATEAQYAALQPIGRMGTPEEIAETVLFLCSDAASFITGVALAADGGIMAG